MITRMTKSGGATLDRRTHHHVTYVVLATGVAAYGLLQSLLNPVLGTIADNLHTSHHTVTWVLTAYLLSASIFTPIMGRIGDMFGKEKTFVVTLVALALGSLLGGLATNITVMIIARVIAGVGGGVLPLAFGIVRDEFPRARVSAAVGSLASITAVGAGLGISLAGPIFDGLGYRWLFWLPMILTAAVAIAAAVLIPESPVRTPGRLSWLPALTLSAWLVALLLALSQAPVWGWGSPRTIGLFLAAVVLAIAWIRAERKSASPLIDLRMMRLRAVWTNNLVALLVGAGMYAVFAFLPQFLQTPASAGYGFGASITLAGLILLPSSVGMFVLGMWVSGLTRWFTAKTMVIVGSLIAAVSMAMLAFAHSAQWQLFLAEAVAGIGLGLVLSAMAGLIVAAVPPEQTGVASGMNANIRTIGGSLGTALMASIVTGHTAASGLPTETGYTIGFAVLGGALVLATIAAFAIPSPTRMPAAPVSP